MFRDFPLDNLAARNGAGGFVEQPVIGGDGERALAATVEGQVANHCLDRPRFRAGPGPLRPDQLAALHDPDVAVQPGHTRGLVQAIEQDEPLFGAWVDGQDLAGLGILVTVELGDQQPVSGTIDELGGPAEAIEDHRWL